LKDAQAMIEVLWFLLPVAAATGWWIGRNDSDKKLPAGGSAYPSDYLKGLNFLLNEQQDEALEVFIRLVRVDGETAETHITLGNLFRRRGEVDRAIRVHQNLVARPTLGSDQRSYALLELARDYLRAGLLDRAEGLFEELVKSRRQVTEALRNLLTIYEREREWELAVKTAKRLAHVMRKDMGHLIAHYYCELSENAVTSEDYITASRMLKRALAADKNSVRASILDGDLAVKEGRYRAAIKSYETVEQQDPEYLPEVIERLLDCMLRDNNPKALKEYLARLSDQYNGFSVIQAATRVIRQLEGDAAADAFFKDQIIKRPSLRGLRHWANMELQSSDGKRRESISIIVDVLDKLLDTKPIYQCRSCGFKGRVLYWQCPGCQSWNSVKPIIGIEGE
jgi:lipopolysaccharide biosynthesis regulator YciM